jgi:DNA-binding NarL/FixJ family response regulator
MKTSISITILDDHQMVLDSLKQLLESMEEFTLHIETFTNYSLMLAYLAKNETDVIILDLHMPKKSGIEISHELKAMNKGYKILLLTMADDGNSIKQAIQAGVNGYLLKKASKAELCDAVLAIYNGKNYFSQDLIQELAHIQTDENKAALPQNVFNLTPREMEVLQLIAAEFTTMEISEKLFLSFNTVESHRGNLMKKMNSKTSIGMVKIALKHKLVSLF